ncbi:MerR family transcriptional regulator [Thiomicrospira sp. R3]|uniref:MerR family transcriptional regulator n=1 Tax=Thiomicrospira sp. R3 TaxID=3035472 RepID=UPI00259B3610|nr:MerR family transcriptional regulator [Thiomicrospira sp. R3]WFE67780.1 MerR family transcriptional regulator [Thiomicrospira sp. R3]
MKKLDPNALFPIREVSRLTGIKPITLRAWERRYELIEPVRTESGHRLYTQDHIDYLNQALRLMDKGIPISRVKSVLSEAPVVQMQMQPEHHQSESIHSAIRAVTDFDLTQLERSLDRLFADYSLKPLLPLLTEVDNALSTDPHTALALNLWHTCVTQRIQVRLHQFQQSNRFTARTLFIQRTPHSSVWMTKFIALFCFEQGYQPLHFDKILALDSVQELHEQLDLHGFILVDNLDSDYQQWSPYIKNFSSIKSWVLGGSDLEALEPPSVNCELRAWPNWLKSF